MWSALVLDILHLQQCLTHTVAFSLCWCDCDVREVPLEWMKEHTDTVLAILKGFLCSIFKHQYITPELAVALAYLLYTDLTVTDSLCLAPVTCEC